MLNCLFFRIFSSVSFVSLYQTKAQRSGFCLELRSKGAERGMPSPAGRYTRSGLCDEVVGVGFCPIFGIWQDAGIPATSQMRCWLLPNGRIFPRSSRMGGFFPAAAGIFCAALEPARTLAQRGLFRLRCAHIRSRGAKPHTAATRASRRGAGARPAGRVDRVDFSHGGKIGTFGTPERDQPLSVAAVDLDQNPVFP